MPQLEIPDVDNLARIGAVRRFVDEFADAEFFWALAVLAALTVIAVTFGDPLTPFYSFCFVFGIAAVFFFAISFSSLLGLVLAAGLLALMLCVSWAAGPAPLTIFLFESPFLALFMVGLAILPNLRPWMLEVEARNAEELARTMEAKVQDLERQLASQQKEARVDHHDKHKKEVIKFSSRTAVLHSFTRELLQSSSQREVLNVLFYNFTRVFGVQECLLFVRNPGAQELLLTRVVHAAQAELENKRLDINLPLFRLVFDAKREIYFDRPEVLDTDIAVSLLVPILVDAEIYAVFAIGKTKTGDLQREEADFVLSMTGMATGAIEQLKMVLAA
ncbi:MAG: GAF domain-containing protein [Candidatus Wallbacteria bacterium]|nr:GAF domain-containing protein [Candidatus Wallbacteria bacterium]